MPSKGYSKMLAFPQTRVRVSVILKRLAHTSELIPRAWEAMAHRQRGEEEVVSERGEPCPSHQPAQSRAVAADDSRLGSLSSLSHALPVAWQQGFLRSTLSA